MSVYYHFILLLWEDHQMPKQEPIWRLSLEDPHTTQRTGFKSVQELAEFLDAWMKKISGNQPT